LYQRTHITRNSQGLICGAAPPNIKPPITDQPPSNAIDANINPPFGIGDAPRNRHHTSMALVGQPSVRGNVCSKNSHHSNQIQLNATRRRQKVSNVHRVSLLLWLLLWLHILKCKHKRIMQKCAFWCCPNTAEVALSPLVFAFFLGLIALSLRGCYCHRIKY